MPRKITKRTVLQLSEPVRMYIRHRMNAAEAEGYPVTDTYITELVEEVIRATPATGPLN